MYFYQRTIISGDVYEVETYRSIRKRDKKCIGRSVRRSRTSEKQKELNDIRAKKKCQRLILNNFVPGDMYLTLSSFADMSEEEFRREVRNFLRRISYYRKKMGMSELKYIGCVECGVEGKRWHGHIIINKTSFEVVSELWRCGRIFSEALYADGGFKDLANYIRKDVKGQKRLLQSRNLVPPREKVVEIGKRTMRRYENGEVPRIPEGYYLHNVERLVSDITGMTATFTMLPILDKRGKKFPQHE